MYYNSTPYFYILNLQGDVIRMVDGVGNIVANYEYDPYGKVISATGWLAEVNPLRYRGYYYDTETSLYYLWSRYYDPQTCRFINADEFSSTGLGIIGNNMFAYCNNNPVNYSDPSGRAILIDDAIILCVAVIAVVVIAVGTGVAINYSKRKKPSNLPSWNKLKVAKDHILSGHTPNGSRNPNGNKSVFTGLTTSQIMKAIREAYETSKRLKTQGYSVKLKGYSESFGIWIEMWVNLLTNIIETAYPK